VLSWSARRSSSALPSERILVPPPSGSARRVAGRLAGITGADRFADALLPRIARVNPDVVHAHFGWAGVQALPLARRLGVPLVVTFHATDITVWPHLPRWRQRLTGNRHRYDELFAELDRAITVSEYMREQLRELGFDRQIDVVPAGVRLEKFPARQEQPPESPTRLLFVGRLVRRKGLDVLLRALPLVARHDKSVRLEIVGDGPEREPAVALAGELGILDRIAFHYVATPQEVAAQLRAAHLFVMPSRRMPDGEVEGSPVVTKEALAVGVPVVATRNGGLPETIPPRYRDELVAEDDPEALADRIIALLEDRPSWPERAREGRRWVEHEFAWAALGRKTAEIYGQALDGAPADGGRVAPPRSLR
jgi:glycosyltransferase involved in cell wall biosynthesis